MADVDLDSYNVANNEVTNATKQTNMVQAIEAGINGRIDEALGTTQGDTLYWTSAGAPARLAKGTALQYYRMNAAATAPEWATLVTSATSGTSFPGSPASDDEYVYVADASEGVYWRFKYRTATTKWIFNGGAPLEAEVATAETTPGTSYDNMSTTGPAVTLPFAMDADVEIGALIATQAGQNQYGWMSYAIGGTAAADADAIKVGQAGSNNASPAASAARRMRKTGLTAVTLTAKYKHETSGATISNRYIAVTPVQK